MEVPVNYWAVLACGIASMVLGFLWYGVLFGKTWMRLMGYSENHQPDSAAANRGYALAFIGSLIMAYVFSHTLVFASEYMNTQGIMAGLSNGFWMWLGFIAPVTLGSVLWEGKSWKLWCFNNTYNLVQLLMFGIILSLWK